MFFAYYLRNLLKELTKKIKKNNTFQEKKKRREDVLLNGSKSLLSQVKRKGK